MAYRSPLSCVPAFVLLALLVSSAAVAETTDNVKLGTFIEPADLKVLLDAHEPGQGLVVIDARGGNDYATEHIPGAINLPPETMRTPKARPGKGYSQYLFRVNDDYETGPLDIARYTKILGKAGIEATDTLVVYGDHAGKANGSVPLMILDMLGHRGGLHFLDGRGFERWIDAGYEVTPQPTRLGAAVYEARPRDGVVWNLPDVLDRLGDGSVVFYDTRSLPEFTGENPRNNARGGHIPGAVRIDYADLMDADHHTLAAERIAALHDAAGITPDKTVVLYCQTSTRVSLPYLALRELGYENLVVYDASMFEYLNREDTPVDTGEPAAQAEILDKMEREGRPDMLSVDDEDQAMNRAIATARETLQGFIEALHASHPNHQAFIIKRGFPYGEEDGAEHIWLSELTWDGNRFTGRIDNDPAYDIGFKLGDRVEVAPEDISDWMYVDGRTVVGGYTLRVLHYASSEEDQKAFLDHTGLIIPPVDF